MLTRTEKINTLLNGYADCMRNHLCGDYIRYNESDYHWGVEVRPRSYWFIVDGVGKMKYDFDFSFDSNLEALVEKMGEWVGY